MHQEFKRPVDMNKILSDINDKRQRDAAIVRLCSHQQDKI